MVTIARIGCFYPLLMATVAFSMALPSSSLSARLDEPFTISDAIHRALATNPRIKRQAQVVKQAREEVDVAFSEFLPHVDYSYQQGRNRTRTSTQRWADLTQRVRELRVEQPLFRGGSSVAGLERAEILLAASKSSYLTAEQLVLSEAASAYIRLYTLRQIMHSIKKNRAALRGQLELTSSRYELQDVTVTDLAQAKARLALAEADYENTMEQLKQSAAMFRRVIGVPPPEELAEPVLIQPLPDTEEELLMMLDARNPRMRQAKLEEQAAEEGADSARGALLPRVSLIGTSRRSKGERFITGFDEFDEDALMVNVTIPIYQGGANWARWQAARYAAEEAKYAALDIDREIREEAILSWEAYQAAELIHEANTQAAAAAENALEGMREEYNYGQRTLTDVLDAERELLRAEVELARSEEQRMSSAYELLALLNAIKPQIPPP